MKKLLSLILSLAMIFVCVLPVSMVSASAGTDATLIDICFENHSVFDFEPDKTTYTVEQPYRFSKTGDNFPKPAVSATPADPNATVEITTVADVEEEGIWNITIKVTAANGVTERTYKLTTKQVGANAYKNTEFTNGQKYETDFESGVATGWNNDGGTISVTAAKAYTGTYSMEYIPKDSSTFPFLNVATASNNGLVWFSSYAANLGDFTGLRESNRATNLNTTYIFIDDSGATLKTNENTSNMNLANGVGGYTGQMYTPADADKWQRSMRISKATGATGFQGCATSSYADNNRKMYLDEFYMGPLVISEIKVSGAAYVSLGEETTLNYSATLLNQYGNTGGLKGEITGESETVTWKLINAPSGVTIDNTGVVTIAETASESGDFYVEAQVLNPTFNTLASGASQDYLKYCQTSMGGRIKVSLLPEGATANLSDIEVNGGGIAGFNSNVKEYDIYVPYSYSPNNFGFARPTVSVTPVMDNADVEITYPEIIADGEKIYINVQDSTGSLSACYTLTIRTVGGNLFPDGGFENTSAADYSNQDAGYIQDITIIDDTTGAGNKVLKASGSRNDSSILGTLANKNSDGSWGVVLNKDKSYISGFMIKKDPNTPAGNTNTNAIVRVGGLGVSSVDGKRYYNNTGNTPTNGGEPLGVNFAIPSEWTTYSSVLVSLDQNGMSGWQNINRRVGFDIGSPTIVKPTAADYATKAAYFLFDDMYIGELVIADMDLADAEGEAETTIDQGEAKTVKLEVAVANQYGNTNGITNTLSYEVINGYQGVTVANDGTVTIANDAAAGTAIIEATVIPTYKGAAQPYVKQRYSVTIIPENGFVYSAGTISAGDIVTTLNYTAQENVELMFVNALYENVNGAWVFKNCVTDNRMSLVAGQFVSKDLTLTVPQTGTYCIKSYLFEKGTLKPIFNTIGTLGQ